MSYMQLWNTRGFPLLLGITSALFARLLIHGTEWMTHWYIIYELFFLRILLVLSSLDFKFTSRSLRSVRLEMIKLVIIVSLSMSFVSCFLVSLISQGLVCPVFGYLPLVVNH